MLRFLRKRFTKSTTSSISSTRSSFCSTRKSMELIGRRLALDNRYSEPKNWGSRLSADYRRRARVSDQPVEIDICDDDHGKGGDDWTMGWKTGPRKVQLRGRSSSRPTFIETEVDNPQETGKESSTKRARAGSVPGDRPLHIRSDPPIDHDNKVCAWCLQYSPPGLKHCAICDRKVISIRPGLGFMPGTCSSCCFSNAPHVKLCSCCRSPTRWHYDEIFAEEKKKFNDPYAWYLLQFNKNEET